ncbi:MAG: hypothetical protein AVDCRST_MAG08-2688, partial [uncultured Acetobacteraceae bacterium]
ASAPRFRSDRAAAWLRGAHGAPNPNRTSRRTIHDRPCLAL